VHRRQAQHVQVGPLAPAGCLGPRRSPGQWRTRYLAAFRAAADAYLAGVAWEPRDVFEGRSAWLLPGLLLARVDGKSPVEYLTEEADRKRIRACAKPLVLAPRTRLVEVAEAWRQMLERAAA